MPLRSSRRSPKPTARLQRSSWNPSAGPRWARLRLRHRTSSALPKSAASSGCYLIADEVMTGFGRTGRRFAMDHFGVAPDIIAAGKGISSGYAPLGAVIAQRHVVDAIANGTGTLLHGFTYNGHPVAVAAGRGVLHRLLEGKLVEAADSKREGSLAFVLREELQKLRQLDCVGDVRGIGLLWAVELVADKRLKTPFPAERKFSAQGQRLRREARCHALSHAGLCGRPARRPRDDRTPGGDNGGRNSLGGAEGGRGDPRSGFAANSARQKQGRGFLRALANGK